MPSSTARPTLATLAAAAGTAAIAVPLLASAVLTPTQPGRVLKTRDELLGTSSRLFLFVAGHGFSSSNSSSSGPSGGAPAAKLSVEVSRFNITAAERLAFLGLVCGQERAAALSMSQVRETPGLHDAVCAMLPHSLAQPLMLEIMVHAGFPLKAIGAVHLRSTFRVHDEARLTAALLADGKPLPLRMTASYLGARVTASGVETLIQLAAYDAAAPHPNAASLLWSETVTILKATKLSSDSKRRAVEASYKAHVSASLAEPSSTVNFASIPAEVASKPQQARGLVAISGDETWGFGILTGDVNPIHMYTTGARLFGQKGRIAHGALVIAKAITARGEPLPKVWSLVFKGPVPCGSCVTHIDMVAGDGATGFDVITSDPATGVPLRPGKSNICVRFHDAQDTAAQLRGPFTARL